MIVSKDDKILVFGQEAIVLEVRKITCRTFAYLDRSIVVPNITYKRDYVEINEITKILDNESNV